MNYYYDIKKFFKLNQQIPQNQVWYIRRFKRIIYMVFNLHYSNICLIQSIHQKRSQFILHYYIDNLDKKLHQNGH